MWCAITSSPDSFKEYCIIFFCGFVFSFYVYIFFFFYGLCVLDAYYNSVCLYSNVIVIRQGYISKLLDDD